MKKVVVFLCLSLVIGLFFRQSVQAQNRKVDLTLVGLMSDSVFDSSEVDEKPEFPGGMDSLYNFIYARLEKSTYSEEEVQNAEKKVYTVSFVVEKDGSIDFVRVRYYGKSSEDEVYRNAKILRLFKQMPKWKPGKRDGEAVDVYYTIHFGDKFWDKNYLWGDAIPQSMRASTNSVYEISEVDDAPEFPGGVRVMVDYIREVVTYPPLQVCAEGQPPKVIVQMVVRKDGSLDNIEVVRSVSPALDKNALRITEEMPRWKPGVKGGKMVDTKFVFPVSFVLH